MSGRWRGNDRLLLKAPKISWYQIVPKSATEVLSNGPSKTVVGNVCPDHQGPRAYSDGRGGHSLTLPVKMGVGRATKS